MSEQKIIAVVGATGAQGGGLARAIVTEPDGDPRAFLLARILGAGQPPGIP
jgi:hypothetical protein